MAQNEIDNILTELEQINRKLAILIEDGHPANHEFISVYFILLLVIISFLTIIWGEFILKRTGIKDGKNIGIAITLTIVGILLLYLLVLHIQNTKHATII